MSDNCYKCGEAIDGRFILTKDGPVHYLCEICSCTWASTERIHNPACVRHGVAVLAREPEVALGFEMDISTDPPLLRDSDDSEWTDAITWARSSPETIITMMRDLWRRVSQLEQELAEEKEMYRTLQEALRRIVSGGRCDCDHSDENCCEKVGYFCPRCIAERALTPEAGTRGGRQ